MSPRATVTVVIPVHNGAAYIGQTLAAIAAQTQAAVEIIVVDDGSTDASLQAVSDSGVRTTVVRKANGGVSGARNVGLERARGDFICFVDQDDHWYPQHLERQLGAFAASPDAGVVVSPYQHWHTGPRGFPAPEAVLPPEPAASTDPDFCGWVYHQFMLDCWALTSATLIRREVLEAHGGFDANLPFSEDWDLWLRLSRQVQFTKITWPPVLYRQHPDQGTRTVRAVDWRCRLLLRNQAAHGLASADGRDLPAALFDQTLSRYELEFGCLHIDQGALATGFKAVLAAWRRDPRQSPRAARAVAAALKRRVQSATAGPRMGAHDQ